MALFLGSRSTATVLVLVRGAGAARSSLIPGFAAKNSAPEREAIVQIFRDNAITCELLTLSDSADERYGYFVEPQPVVKAGMGVEAGIWSFADGPDMYTNGILRSLVIVHPA